MIFGIFSPLEGPMDHCATVSHPILSYARKQELALACTMGTVKMPVSGLNGDERPK